MVGRHLQRRLDACIAEGPDRGGAQAERRCLQVNVLRGMAGLQKDIPMPAVAVFPCRPARHRCENDYGCTRCGPILRQGGVAQLPAPISSGYTMVPPSVHPNGEHLTWIRFNIGAANDKSYKKLHGADEFYRFLGNVSFCLETKRKKNLPITIGFQAVLTPKNIGEMVELAKLGKQIVMALRQAESGTRVTEICRKLGVSEATFYRWKKRYGSLGVSELRDLRQLKDENRRLKGLVADLSLDKSILQETLRKNF